ncbi:MAG: leucine--tRNA ligase [Pseudomonadota bacterium]
MTEPTRYNFRETEAKWQRYWADNATFKTDNNSAKPKYYVLEMFPYPSGNIHMGHVRNYTLGDVVARSKRAQGYNVLHPMGWDAFGLPAENAAIQNNSHPEDWTLANIDTMRDQLKPIGLSYDWSRELATCLPDYYKHEQLFFLKFLEKGIAYRKEAEVNWDPIDNTVLANEQVIDGRGWRSGALVERRKLSQWFLRISDFADELLEGLDTLKEWPEKVRLMQERWIGKSQGASLRLRVNGGQWMVDGEEWLDIYTTRPDTIFGMSFCAISPQHPLVSKILSSPSTIHNPLSTFIAECNTLGTSEEAIEKAEKKGFDTGLKIVHPFNGKEVPLYIANFVLMDYGTGAIFGCPAHDQRDHDFARKYDLPITPVIDGDPADFRDAAYAGNGVMINSDFLNGLPSDEAKKIIISKLEKLGLGNEKINYRLRDWGVSRQRYWGCPIPIIHCSACGIVPVPEKDLPVELPKDVTFDKTGNPLEHHATWKHVNCPSCGKPARRETDTFDTFFESSWYYYRFATLPSENPLDPQAVKKWLPENGGVDCYIGGIEHAVLHLLYSRFFTRALNKCGLVDNKEPFKRLETQGMISHETYKNSEGKWISPDEIGLKAQDLGLEEEKLKPQAISHKPIYVELKTGKPVTIGRIEKMSKSKKNTISPHNIIETYGVDAARLFMLSDSPPERDLEWTDAGIEGAWRYINRLWRLVQSSVVSDQLPEERNTDNRQLTTDNLKKLTHKTIAAVTEDLERFHFNKAIARIRELTNLVESTPNNTETSATRMEAIIAAVHLINPFMPHLAEELWQQLGNKDTLADRPWLVADSAWLVDDSVTVAIQVNGKLRSTIDLPKDCDKKTTEEKALAVPAIRELLKDKKVNKVIVVPNRIVNVVIQ